MSANVYYTGRGKPTTEPPPLPVIDRGPMKSPEGYRASPGLAAAVDVALRLGMPLLLTGDPGIGKSRLAHSVAWELGLGEPLVFVVKSDTTGHELFYQFDTVGRFHAANEGKDIDPRCFVQFNALGRAILHTYEAKELRDQLGPAFDALGHPGRPRRSVVLIDEIDKAPRDVPNDLLWEVDDMSFAIREFAYLKPPANIESPASAEATLLRPLPSKFEIRDGAGSLHPIVIITSNSEKALPDAFLRRCVYYHVPFPDFSNRSIADCSADASGPVTVQTIVASRLGARYVNGHAPLVEEAVACFRYLREQSLERPPGLAELLAWLDYLLPSNGARRSSSLLTQTAVDEWLPGISATLLRNRNDQLTIADKLREWQRQARPR